MNTITYKQLYYEAVAVKGGDVEGWLYVSALAPDAYVGPRIPYILLRLEVNDEVCSEPEGWHPPSNIEMLPRAWQTDTEIVRSAISLIDRVASAIKRYGWPTFLEEAIELAS